MAVEVQRKRFTVEEYHRMGEAGIFGPDDRVELLDGDIIEMGSIGPAHAAVVAWLTSAFRNLPPSLLLSVENPVTLDGFGEPQPDFMADVLLVVEVADSSATFDRGTKLPHCATRGIAEAWLVDLQRGVLEIHESPSAAGYGTVRVTRPGELVQPRSYSFEPFPLVDRVSPSNR